MPAALETYIKDARLKNLSDEKIKQALLAAGWPEAQVTEALVPKPTDPAVPPPPPPPVPHVGMWVGFLYILFFISLYVLATSIGGILHEWVDLAIPNTKDSLDRLSRVGETKSLVRGFIAALIVSYPIFLTLAIILKKQLAKQPLVKNLRSRKILIYITLIATFLIMLGHIIVTIYTFLDGRLTTNALGHLGVTFLVAGSIFWYFINEVKNDRKTT